MLLGALLYSPAPIGGSYGWAAAAGGEWGPLLTRNGPPFFSLLFVALGAELRLRAWQPDARRCALMMMAGMGLYALEAAGLLRVAAVPCLVMISCWAHPLGAGAAWPAAGQPRMGQRQLAGAPGPQGARPLLSAHDAGGVADDLRPPGQTGVVGTPQGTCAAGAHSAPDCRYWRLPGAALVAAGGSLKGQGIGGARQHRLTAAGDRGAG